MNQLMPDISQTATTKSKETKSNILRPVILKSSEKNVSSDRNEQTDLKKENASIVNILPKLNKPDYMMSSTIPEMMNFTTATKSIVVVIVRNEANYSCSYVKHQYAYS
jgi:hypothetical protein